MSHPSFTVHPVASMGAEDVLVGPDGTVWTGTEDGAIWALDPATGSTRRVADTGGRPLGLELLGDGDLLVCDARRGLLRVSPVSGSVDVLCDRIEGAPMRFCNNAAVAGDGTIWFSDSSRHYGVAGPQRRICAASPTRIGPCCPAPLLRHYAAAPATHFPPPNQPIRSSGRHLHQTRSIIHN